MTTDQTPTQTPAREHARRLLTSVQDDLVFYDEGEPLPDGPALVQGWATLAIAEELADLPVSNDDRVVDALDNVVDAIRGEER